MYELVLTLIKTNVNNENTNKNRANFLVALLLTNGPLTIPYSQSENWQVNNHVVEKLVP